MCDKLNGYLPTITEHGKEENDAHYENFNIFQQIFRTDENKCFLSEDTVKVWLSIQKNLTTGEWFNPYQKNQTVNLDFRNAPGMDCSYLFGKKAQVQSCTDDNFPCGVCTLPENKILYMKGLCKDDRHNLYDVQYYVHGVMNNRPHIR